MQGPAPSPTPLARRLARPQRHRLLHGYPMAPLLSDGDVDRAAWARRAPERPLLVGVLPHAMCAPAVAGCGFCTFPHERFDRGRALRSCAEVAAKVRAARALSRRRVRGVYFGGGTANLTPPEGMGELARALEETFDLSGAEITLEGIPRAFLAHDAALLDRIARMGAERRISMGVQTLDPAWLARMGRAGFGDRDDLARVVSAAHARGMTASADLLVNLPGPHDPIADVEGCAALGFDQVCLYNLVLSPDLGVPWAGDRALLGRMPDNARAFEAWRGARARLLELGFEQTTLTNFERGPRRFVYERASFDPARHDAIGFGPHAISTFVAPRGAVKWVDDPGGPRSFVYGPRDLRLLLLTRNLSALRVDADAYEDLFGARPEDDFGRELDELRAAGLCDDALALTERGMFFADAVAGHLADARVRELRWREPRVNPAAMG